MKPHYSARLERCTQSTDSKTGGPLPLRIQIAIPSYATGLAILRDLSAGRVPITIVIEAVQAHLPEPE